MLSTQSFNVAMGMSLKMRTNLRSTRVPGLMPKRVSTPAINSLISSSRARDWLGSSGLLRACMGLAACMLKLGAGAAEVTARAVSTADRIWLSKSLTFLSCVTVFLFHLTLGGQGQGGQGDE